VVFNFGFDNEDRTSLYGDHDRTVLVREVDVARDLPSAVASAQAWVGKAGEQFPFQNIPGVYQAAFVEFVTGNRVEMSETEFMWALPAEGDHVPFREFPPRLKESDTSPGPDKVGFALFPRQVVEQMYKKRGW
jgi:hypothetical protein